MPVQQMLKLSFPPHGECFARYDGRGYGFHCLLIPGHGNEKHGSVFRIVCIEVRVSGDLDIPPALFKNYNVQHSFLLQVSSLISPYGLRILMETTYLSSSRSSNTSPLISCITVVIFRTRPLTRCESSPVPMIPSSLPAANNRPR